MKKPVELARRAFGILDNDYDVFFRRRCRKLSAELNKLILPAEADDFMSPAPRVGDG